MSNLPENQRPALLDAREKKLVWRLVFESIQKEVEFWKRVHPLDGK